MGHTTVKEKGSEHRIVKRQKENERKSILDWYLTIFHQSVQQQVNTPAETLDNLYAFWSCWQHLIFYSSVNYVINNAKWKDHNIINFFTWSFLGMRVDICLYCFTTFTTRHNFSEELLTKPVYASYITLMYLVLTYVWIIEWHICNFTTYRIG